MGGTSTIFAYEQALLANLKVRQGLFNVQVLAGPPTTGQSVNGEFIMLGNSQAGQVYKTFPYNAPTAKDETGTLDMLIDVVQAINADHSAVTARAFDLLAEVENELRENPSQGVPYGIWAEVSRNQTVSKRMNPESGWRETLITAQIYIRSRI